MAPYTNIGTRVMVGVPDGFSRSVVLCGFIEDLKLWDHRGLICRPAALAFTGLRDSE